MWCIVPLSYSTSIFCVINKLQKSAGSVHDGQSTWSKRSRRFWTDLVRSRVCRHVHAVNTALKAASASATAPSSDHAERSGPARLLCTIRCIVTHGCCYCCCCNFTIPQFSTPSLQTRCACTFWFLFGPERTDPSQTFFFFVSASADGENERTHLCCFFGVSSRTQTVAASAAKLWESATDSQLQPFPLKRQQLKKSRSGCVSCQTCAAEYSHPTLPRPKTI